jgi:tRNA(Arg) A34 adenosine deaminase TadA
MDERFMRMAIDLAIQNASAGGGGPFGAVVVRDGEVLATGTNGVTSTNDPTAHAEITAIRQACRVLGGFQLPGCALYTSCEPCPMCLGAIYWARPASVFYACTAADAAAAGFDDSFIFDELRLDPGQRHISMKQLLRSDALAAFRTWEQKADRIPY